MYDNYVEWYDYFNSQIKPQSSKKHTFNVDQIEEYLKMLYGEIENMIEDLRGILSFYSRINNNFIINGKTEFEGGGNYYPWETHHVKNALIS